MVDVRRCPQGHPASELETHCPICGVELAPLERAPDRPADDDAPALPWSGTRSGWPNIGIGMVIVVVSGLALIFTLPLDFPVLTVLLSALGLLGGVNLTIGAVAQGIRIALGPSERPRGPSAF